MENELKNRNISPKHTFNAPLSRFQGTTNKKHSPDSTSTLTIERSGFTGKDKKRTNKIILPLLWPL